MDKGRTQERLFLGLIAILLVTLFIRLFGVLQGRMKDVDQRLKDGTVVNLNAPEPAKAVKALLTRGYYLEDPLDIDIISNSIAAQEAKGLSFTNIGDLNKRKFNVVADEAFNNGGAAFKKRVAVSRSLLGFTGDDEARFTQEKNNASALPAVKNLGMGNGVIKGKVEHKGDAVAGVLVRLSTVLPADSVDAKSFAAYARTDGEGSYAFNQLPEEKAYEVIPLKPGSEFGQVKGVQELNGSKQLNFNEASHVIRLLSSREFNVLKNDGALIVRTPEQFKFWYFVVTGGFLLAFVIIHLLLSFKFTEADQLILPLLMLLTGLSFLTLLSLQDPVRDRFLAVDSLWFLYLGVAGLGVLLFLNLKRFTADSGFYRLFIFKDRSAANGWPWIAGAILLLAGTLLFGAGPEGSGVKVNLLGVQPSEVVKYIVVLF